MTAVTRFQNRSEAGRLLAQGLVSYANRSNVIVLALPRGGLPVGYEVARALHAPLDVYNVRKLGTPGHEELAMGAVASGGTRVLNEEVVRGLGIGPDIIDRVAHHEEAEVRRRDQLYRDHRSPPQISGKRVILVDDGLATGSTMRAAVAAVTAQAPAELIIAVPVAPEEICQEFSGDVDRVFCLINPDPFYSVGFWYHEFPQLTDQNVREILRRSERNHADGKTAAAAIHRCTPTEVSR